MDAIQGDRLLGISRALDPILTSLASIRTEIERAKPSVLVDHYFSILVAFERIQEARDRLVKVAEQQKEKAARGRKSLMPFNILNGENHHF